MASVLQSTTCDGCSSTAGGPQLAEVTTFAPELCDLKMIKCTGCEHRACVVTVTFLGAKIKFNVNPTFISNWIENYTATQNAQP